MDFKKNYSSNIQVSSQIKPANLANPLISIANASTPVRKRVVKPSSQMNSTPINIHKIGHPIKSPTLSNKENSQSNTGNNKIGFRKQKITEKNINLSPIMALNRKMSEGPKFQKRCFTPTGLKRQQSSGSFLEQSSDDYQASNDYMLGETNSSNCFKKMIQNRSKTPTRMLGEQRQSNSTQNFGGLKSSGSVSSLLTSKMKESRTNLLASSGSFESFRSTGTSQLRQNQVACINEHERKAKAKYKVIEDSDQDDEILVYCSRCAILLVKKGFKVEELTPEDIFKIKNQQQNTNNNSSYRQHNQYYDYADQTSRKLQIRFEQIKGQRQAMISIHEKAIQDIDCYYNSIIALVQQQKNHDRQVILAAKEQDLNSGEILEIKIGEGINHLENIVKTGRVSNGDLETIKNLESMMTTKCSYTHRLNTPPIVDNIQHKFDSFTEVFQLDHRLFLENQEKNPIKKYRSNPIQHNGNQSIENALRFSFEKNIKSGKNTDYGNKTYQGYLGAQNEQIVQMQGEQSSQLDQANQKKAFRTLFPEESQRQGSQGEKNGIHSPTFKQF